MFTLTLERQELNIPDWFDKNTGFLNTVKSKLGYHQLEQVRKDVILAQTLNQLGIRPFTMKSVEQYKKSKQRAANKYFALLVTVLIVTWGLILFGKIIPDYIIDYAFRHNGMNPHFLPLVGLSVLTTTIAFGVSVVFMVFLSGINIDLTKEWCQFNLDGYRRPVPIDVLRMASEIKEVLPSATFYIDELVTRKMIDPFLVVYNGNRNVGYYIAVWNEPTFNIEN
jgi:hypothetical protein